MSQKARVPEVNSATQIVKGAVNRVFGSTKTVSVECHKKTEGRLTIVSAQAPQESQLKELERLSNDLIAKNVAIQTETLSRSDAETKYGKDKIYDKIEPAAAVQELTIVSISDWVVNSCLGTHVATTGAVRPIKNIRCNYRENKSEATLIFEFGEAGSAAAASAATTKKGAKNTPATTSTPTLDYNDTKKVSAQVLTDLAAELKKLNVQVPAELESLMLPLLNQRFTAVKNAAFAKGANALGGNGDRVKMGLAFPQARATVEDTPAAPL
ncbi:alanyl-tRNA synthetase-like protein [Planoprotostelium fungivorum]|uniref:Alanyl-tRNA synthetase-like protein n=1 Tax=Planoprotostelium fungivorum TaxID=1890364 RepID=A0A2P6NYL9_9EUKA|nr:alanyl-tRNA synthetase-like protein [Planoprotostelium fungivorum]